MTHLLVEQPGPATTVQDAGRLAWQHVGVAPGGFADPLLAALANALVANAPDAAVLEWTQAGDVLRVVGGSVRVAIAGWTDAQVDGVPVPTFRGLRLHDGQTLTVGPLRLGRHGVLAVAGGLQTPLVLGSRATHARTGVGGQRLAAGNVLPVLPVDPATADRVLAESLVPRPQPVVRVLAAPQHTLFTADALALLVAEPWQVLAGDRMGLRLQGPPLRLLPGAEPVSEGVVTGALQVPPSGQPIALGPDRQTIGGYAKLAVGITADLRHLAQRTDGATVRFVQVDATAARGALQQAQAELGALLAAMRTAHDVLPHESPRLLHLLS